MRRLLRDNALAIFFLVIFLAALGAQALVGHRRYNQDQMSHHASTISLGRYLTSSEFGSEVMKNWQSEYLEFLAIGSMAVFSVYLRQRGSPESKPVGAPHDATGVEG